MKTATQPSASIEAHSVHHIIHNQISIEGEDQEIMLLINAFMRVTSTDFDDVAYMLGLTAQRAKELKDTYAIQNAEHMNALVAVMKKMQKSG